MIIPSYKSKIDSINKMYNDEIRRCNGEERYLSLIDEYYKLIDDLIYKLETLDLLHISKQYYK